MTSWGLPVSGFCLLSALYTEDGRQGGYGVAIRFSLFLCDHRCSARSGVRQAARRSSHPADFRNAVASCLVIDERDERFLSFQISGQSRVRIPARHHCPLSRRNEITYPVRHFCGPPTCDDVNFSGHVVPLRLLRCHRMWLRNCPCFPAGSARGVIAVSGGIGHRPASTAPWASSAQAVRKPCRSTHQQVADRVAPSASPGGVAL